MQESGHNKHNKLSKPEGGQFHRHEIAFIGAPCSTIQKLARDVSSQLDGRFSLSYVDAEHQSSGGEDEFDINYTDKITRQQVSFRPGNMDQRYRALFSDSDAVLVNGNHFSADKQVVIIHPAKEDSLKRKLDRLTDVGLILLSSAHMEIYPFLRDKLDLSNIPVLLLDEHEKIAAEIEAWIAVPPPVRGLVIAGGKSTRMGEDKPRMEYYGKPQWQHMADILQDLGLITSISVASGRELETDMEQIVDTFLDLGPYGALLSAFRRYPNAAWLAVAIDIPLLDKETLSELLTGRDPGKMATCFHNPDTGFPEPLITLWEPRAYPRLLEMLSLGYSCPRKALINSSIKEISIGDPMKLKNVNTPEEKEQVLAIIQNSLKGINR